MTKRTKVSGGKQPYGLLSPSRTCPLAYSRTTSCTFYPAKAQALGSKVRECANVGKKCARTLAHSRTISRTPFPPPNRGLDGLTGALIGSPGGTWIWARYPGHSGCLLFVG